MNWPTVFVISTIVVAATTVSPFLARAGEEGPLENYTGLCTEEQSVGFIWRNDGWEKTSYSVENIMIKKMKESECSTEKQWIWSGCYNIRKQGEIIFSPSNEWCSERRESNVITVHCKSMIFQYDGNFHRAVLHSNFSTGRDLKNKNENYDLPPDHKDSLSVSVGKCARIE
jgi:hypothetical protein